MSLSVIAAARAAAPPHTTGWEIVRREVTGKRVPLEVALASMAALQATPVPRQAQAGDAEAPWGSQPPNIRLAKPSSAPAFGPRAIRRSAACR